ncbi:hypothetical protein Plec18170_006202 [Paecilomyces lecythidis]
MFNDNKTDRSSLDPKHVRPVSIGHFGLRTTPENFDAMVKWHLDFWGGFIVLQSSQAAFIAYDDEHHRLVIVKDPSHRVIEDRKTAVGIYHIAFTLKSLSELATSYEQKKTLGIIPHWPVNHGISTSMYYSDPDGNEIELQVDNFDTAAEAHAFMTSPEYTINPIGVDINVDEFLGRVRSGEDEKSIKKRPDIGPRLSRWENSIYFSKPAA